MKKNIGLSVKPPESECEDPCCPFHGKLPVRGRVFRGKVISDKAANTVTVQWEHLAKNPKYERYERRRTKVAAHNPSCISAATGDLVLISECRPISKTKKFVVVSILKEGTAVEKVDIVRTYEEIQEVKQTSKKEDKDESTSS